MNETGKIRQALYDEVIAAEDSLFQCEVCLTRGQVRWILSQTDYAGWPTRYYSMSHMTIDTDKIQAMRDDLIERLFMSCCEDSTQAIQRKLDSETGVVLASTDGGISYHPDGEDPRVTGVKLPPAVTSGQAEDKCNAANSVTRQLQIYVDDILDSKTNELGLIDMALAICAVLLAVLVAPAWALLPALILPLIQKIFAASSAELVAAMSVSTYQQFTCIIFCNMSDDGSMSEVQWLQAIQDMREKIGDALAYNTCRAFMLIYGVLGVNNSAAQGLNYGYNCDSCNCDSCFEGWLGETSTTPEPVIDSDDRGVYLQWTSITDAVNARVRVSNDGNWASESPSTGCCRPGANRFAAFLTGTETEATVSVYGYGCGDTDLGHYGVSENLPWWGFEVLGNISQGDYDIRLYL